MLPRKALRCYREVEAILPAGARPGSGRRSLPTAGTRWRRPTASGRRARLRAAKALFSSAGEDHGAPEPTTTGLCDPCAGATSRPSTRSRASPTLRSVWATRGTSRTSTSTGPKSTCTCTSIADARRLALAARQRFDGLGLRKESALASLLAGAAPGWRRRGDSSEAESSLRRSPPSGARARGARRGRAAAAGRAWPWTAETSPGRGASLRRPQALEHADDEPAHPRRGSHELFRARLALARGLPAEAAAWAGIAPAGSGRGPRPGRSSTLRGPRARGTCDGRSRRRGPRRYRAAIRALERYRRGVPPDEYMTAFLAGRSGLYQEIVDLLVRRGDAILAFHYVERVQVPRADRSPRGPAVGARGSPETDDASTRRIAYLRERLNAIYRRLAPCGEDGGRGLRAAERALADATSSRTRSARLLRYRALRRGGDASHAQVDAPSLVDVQRDLDAEVDAPPVRRDPGRAGHVRVTRDAFTSAAGRAPAAMPAPALRRFRFHVSETSLGVAGGEAATRAPRRTSSLLIAPVALAPAPASASSSCRPGSSTTFRSTRSTSRGVRLDRFEVVYAPSAASTSPAAGDGRSRRAGRPSSALPDARRPASPTRPGARARRSAATLHVGPEATFARFSPRRPRLASSTSRRTACSGRADPCSRRWGSRTVG